METSLICIHLHQKLKIYKNIFKPIQVLTLDSRSYEPSCSRWNRVLVPMMARRENIEANAIDFDQFISSPSSSPYRFFRFTFAPSVVGPRRVDGRVFSCA